jgi:preprotein translocase subunit YajC
LAAVFHLEKIMKLIIQVQDKQARSVKKFMEALANPSESNRGSPSVTISATSYSGPAVLKVLGLNITVEGLPENTFKPGDVVENTKSGNWGVIQSIDEYDEITLNCSAETRKDTGKKTLRFHISDAKNLM